MPDALIKAPSLDVFGDEIPEPEKEPQKKYRKVLFIPVLVLLLAGVFSLYPEKEEVIESSIKSGKEPATAQQEDLETKQAGEPEPGKSDQESPVQESPAQESPVQEKPDAPSLEDGEKDYAFKKDKEYLALNRYERPVLKPRVLDIPANERVRNTVAVVDKPLVLAGRGFDIQGFPPHSTGVEVDYLRHLKRPIPKIDRVAPDPLDLQLKQAKSTKYLIFHPLGPALSQLQKPSHEKNPQPPKKPRDLQRIPETKLLFKETAQSELILRPGKESMDLLIGNERLNRKKYDDW